MFSPPQDEGSDAKVFRLLLEKGIVVLKPRELGQTALTFTAEIGVREVVVAEAEKKAPKQGDNNKKKSSSSSFRSTKKANTLNSFKSKTSATVKSLGLGDSVKAEEVRG